MHGQPTVVCSLRTVSHSICFVAFEMKKDALCICGLAQWQTLAVPRVTHQVCAKSCSILTWSGHESMTKQILQSSVTCSQNDSAVSARPYSHSLLPIQDTLKRPKNGSEASQMKKATTLAIFITTGFYMAVGCIGYGAFGDGCAN